MVLGETAPVQSALDDPQIESAWRVWVAMIGGAKQRIDIAQFYAANRPGSRLERVIQAIEAAASRGVKVRFLVEAKMARTYPDTLARLAKHHGIEVRRWRAGDDLGGGILHAKYFMVDGRELWLGSQNFDWRSLMHVQELGVRVNAPTTVAALARIFAYDWALAGRESGAVVAVQLPGALTETVRFGDEATRIRLVASPQAHLPDRGSWDLPALVELIDGARVRVRVQLMSLHLHDRSGGGIPELEAALRRAAGRGVRVEVLLGHWTRSRSRIGHARTLHRVPGITVRLLEVPVAKEGFIPFARVIHAKYMVVDGRRAWLGTSNWGWGYFHNSRNVGLVVAGKRFAAALDRFFERGWRDPGSAEVRLEGDYPRPRIAR